MLQPPINIASRRTAREREMRTPMEKKPFAERFSEKPSRIAANVPAERSSGISKLHKWSCIKAKISENATMLAQRTAFPRRSTTR